MDRPAPLSDRAIATILALLGLGGGGALYVLPHPYSDIVGWSLIAISIVGFILLAIHHFVTALDRGKTVTVGSVIFLCIAAFVFSSYPLRLEDTTALAPRLIDTQVQELQNIDRFVGVRDEYDLDQLFDFSRILTYNIRAYKDLYLHGSGPQPDTNEIDSVFRDGAMRSDSRYARFINTETDKRVELLPGKIGAIKLTAQYMQSRKILSAMILSATTPVAVSEALRELDQAVEANTGLIFDVLNEQLTLDQKNITEAFDQLLRGRL